MTLIQPPMIAIVILLSAFANGCSQGTPDTNEPRDLNVKGNLSATKDLSVGGNANIRGDVLIGGKAEFDGDVSVKGSLTVKGQVIQPPVAPPPIPVIESYQRTVILMGHSVSFPQACMIRFGRPGTLGSEGRLPRRTADACEGRWGNPGRIGSFGEPLYRLAPVPAVRRTHS